MKEETKQLMDIGKRVLELLDENDDFRGDIQSYFRAYSGPNYNLDHAILAFETICRRYDEIKLWGRILNLSEAYREYDAYRVEAKYASEIGRKVNGSVLNGMLDDLVEQEEKVLSEAAKFLGINRTDLLGQLVNHIETHGTKSKKEETSEKDWVQFKPAFLRVLRDSFRNKYSGEIVWDVTVKDTTIETISLLASRPILMSSRPMTDEQVRWLLTESTGKSVILLDHLFHYLTVGFRDQMNGQVKDLVGNRYVNGVKGPLEILMGHKLATSEKFETVETSYSVNRGNAQNLYWLGVKSARKRVDEDAFRTVEKWKTSYVVRTIAGSSDIRFGITTGSAVDAKEGTIVPGLYFDTYRARNREVVAPYSNRSVIKKHIKLMESERLDAFFFSHGSVRGYVEVDRGTREIGEFKEVVGQQCLELDPKKWYFVQTGHLGEYVELDAESRKLHFKALKARSIGKVKS